MLATTSLGAIWTSCSPDFGLQGVIDRFGQVKPKVLFAIEEYQYNGKLINCKEKVKEVVSLIPDRLMSRTAFEILAHPATLDHESGDHAMKYRAVVESLVDIAQNPLVERRHRFLPCPVAVRPISPRRGKVASVPPADQASAS